MSKTETTAPPVSPTAPAAAAKPTIGRIVLVGVDPEYSPDGEPVPGIVTKVHNPTVISATVFPFGCVPGSRDSLLFVESPKDLGPGKWCWLPRE